MKLQIKQKTLQEFRLMIKKVVEIQLLLSRFHWHLDKFEMALMKLLIRCWNVGHLFSFMDIMQRAYKTCSTFSEEHFISMPVNSY